MHHLYVDAEILCAFFAFARIGSYSGEAPLETQASENLFSKFNGMVPAKSPSHAVFNNKGDHDEN